MAKLVYSDKFLKLLAKVSPKYREQYWSKKWRIIPVFYPYKGTHKVFDVRKVFEEPSGKDLQERMQLLDNATKEILKKCKNCSDDDKAIAVWRHVKKLLKYKGDFEVWKKPEMWQSPATTLKLKTGDCEDGAILIAELARRIGIPDWKIKVAAGWVQSPRNKFKMIGHAYAVYLRDRYNDWFVLDWTYYPNITIQNWYSGKPIRETEQYKDTWFTFNWKRSWKQKSFKW